MATKRKRPGFGMSHEARAAKYEVAAKSEALRSVPDSTTPDRPMP